MDVVTAFTLGLLVLPGRLPFSKPKVNWHLQEKTIKNAGGVVCLQKKHPKKSKNILLSMAKISKDAENGIAINDKNAFLTTRVRLERVSSLAGKQVSLYIKKLYICV